MTESDLMRSIQVALSERGHRIFRNNCGQTKTMDGRHIIFGLCVGSSDLIGLTKTGRFLAIEVKTPRGRVTPEQIKFIDMVNSLGGIAGICRSVEDALHLVGDSGS